ncbi:hypothetical protein K491DRAFT_717448 [Lophiostoma macrostomum CBS 122681]|uniref:Uncharacterized protein n=1 Tax=Lophiostoma macrostomum CBS 122681 TaxID=1314788 RepID=A0A6A6T5Q3_9PLEO|nr:hypothetical protein K491DRAFT_717448 [Lophiostoma macrostomum CBS 122681]
MLLSKVVSVVFLTFSTVVIARPQHLGLGNLTITYVPVPTQHGESTASGFEISDAPPRLITTETPVVVSIHTNVDSSGPSPVVSAPPGATSSGNDLISQIISQIATAEPGAQPTGASAVSTDSNGGTTQDQQQATDVTSAHASVPTLSLAESITLGGTVITLTPGLSTTVGTGTSTTLVDITTNTHGQTIVVVSSSGTAVSATMTQSAITLTSPRTNIASVTKAAERSGSTTTGSESTSTSAEATSDGSKIPSSGAAATSGSSKGLAAKPAHTSGGWLVALLLGVGALLR